MTSSTSSNVHTSRMDRRNFLRTATVAGGAAAILAGSGFAMRGSASSLLGSQTTSTPAASPVASPGASPVASPAASGIEIGMIDIGYEVKEFSIPANTDAVVTLVNEGFLQHNFVIDELGIETPLYNGGESGSVTINAPAGTYEYYCSVPGHKEAGMVGTVTVS
ncbi:MAG: plastocyanin/azurin family copper-binding protein [Chloroflexota bacterium]|nr:plastocyanin/azurin family copper-binding protein [Chloroflexota bacterium]